jgi:hypothetical protein
MSLFTQGIDFTGVPLFTYASPIDEIQTILQNALSNYYTISQVDLFLLNKLNITDFNNYQIIVDTSINLLELNKLDITAFDASWNSLGNIFVSKTGDTMNGNYNIIGDLFIDGSLNILGGATTIETETITIKDNIILINSTQTGTPLPTLKSGIEVERGDLTNYQFLFDELSTTFKIGEVGSLQAVATREDTPTNNRIPYWDNNNTRFNTDRLITIDNSNNVSIGSTPLNPYRLDIRNLTTNDTRIMINDCSQCATNSNAMLNLFIRENQTKEHIHFRRAFTTGGGIQIKDFGMSVDEDAGLTMGKYDNAGNYEELLYVNENHTIEVDGAEGGDFVIRGTPNITLSGVNTNLNTNYYTKTATDTLLNGKSNVGHTHPISDITNLQTELNNRYTKTETDTLLNNKSNVGHTHSISDITNLQTELDSKVSLTGNEDIGGIKTFSGVNASGSNIGNYIDYINFGGTGRRVHFTKEPAGDNFYIMTTGGGAPDPDAHFILKRPGGSFFSNILGSLAIGKDTNPATTLDVNGIIRGTELQEGTTKLEDKYELKGAGSSNWTVNGNDIYNSNTGSVGIGTTTPTKSFNNEDLVGNKMLSILGGVSGQNNGSSRLNLGGDNSHYASIIGQHSNNGRTSLQFLTASSATIPTEKMRILDNGNVGINRTNPQLRMEISPVANSSNQNNGLRLSTTGTVGTNSYRFADWRLKSDGSGAFRLGLDVNNDSQFSSAEDVISVRLAGGNVGINTPIPNAKLDVNGTFRANELADNLNVGNNQLFTTNGGGRQMSFKGSISITSSASHWIGDYLPEGGFQNVSIHGTIVVQSGPSFGHNHFKVRIRSNTMPAVDVNYEEEKVIQTYNVNLIVRRNTSTGRVYIGFSLPSGQYQTYWWNIDVYERGNYNRWTNYTSAVAVVGNEGDLIDRGFFNKSFLGYNIGIGTDNPLGLLDINQSYYRTIRVDNAVSATVNIIVMPNITRRYGCRVEYYWDNNGVLYTGRVLTQFRKIANNNPTRDTYHTAGNGLQNNVSAEFVLSTTGISQFNLKFDAFISTLTITAVIPYI